jgi:hypothetical protein
VDEDSGIAREATAGRGISPLSALGVRGAAGLITLGRTTGAGVGMADAEAWSRALTAWSRNPEIYGVIIDACGAPVTIDDGADGLRALYSLVWSLNCFTKPAVTLLGGETPAWAMALALAGTHQAVGAGFRFHVPDSGTPAGFGLGPALAAFDAGTAIGRGEIYAAGLVTHCINEVAFPALTEAMAQADPVDPELDDRHVVQDRVASAAKAYDLRAALIRDFAASTPDGTAPLELVSRAALQAPPT